MNRCFERIRLRLGLLLGLTLAATLPLAAREPAEPAINVILWFDTEDYLLPASDDAAKRLCQMLTQRGIRATFKVVGEKARVLEQRGRQDVIAALQQHDIGYHSNFHSVHPTPAEYLAECGWLDGIAEFVRREGGGADDVRRIFGKSTLSCYGQPGDSWAPQALAALPQIGVAPHGVPCYVDEAKHVGLNAQPFWYVGALNVFNMGSNFTRLNLRHPDALAPAEQAFSGIAERLRKQGGGLISMYYHPCEWVHREFWDSVNFKRGANPPREQWKAPAQLPPEVTETNFIRFGQYLDYLQSVPGVHWVTASDLPLLYPDRVRTEGAPEPDVEALARRLAEGKATGVDMVCLGSRAYSVADQFELLTTAVQEMIAGHALRYPLKASGLIGPDGPPPAAGTLNQLDWFAFRDAAKDVFGFIRTERRIPARVFIGAEMVAPADFLVALARVYEFQRANGRLPQAEGVPLGQQLQLLPAQHVAEDTPELFGNWPIHKSGYQAPKLMELARLQAWTLKPALPAR